MLIYVRIILGARGMNGCGINKKDTGQSVFCGIVDLFDTSYRFCG